MKNRFIVLGTTLCAVLLGWYSCTKDFIEPDITNKSVSIIIPQDNTVSSIATQNFRWDSLPGARNYKFQIVTPSFTAIQKFTLDTTIAGTAIAYVLQPGKSYQWRLRAQNSFSKTAYSTFNLRIDSTGDLSSQTVLFVFPATNNYSSKTAVNTFKWTPLYNAVDYRFQILKPANVILLDTTEVGSSYTASLAQGTYTIQVRAQNNTSNSGYTTRIFNVITTPPGPSMPEYPAYGSSHTGNDTLKWLAPAGRVADSLFIDTDSLFARPHTLDYKTTSTSYVFTTGLSGILYYWRLKTVDAAGNWSIYSGKSTFRVN
jgi:hypothetical protein